METLREKLIDLYTKDLVCAAGCVEDSLEKRVVADELSSIEESRVYLFLARLVRETFLSEEKLSLGFGIQDAVLFIDWLREQIGVDL